MTLREHYRKNFALAWPVVVGQLGHITVGLADSIMIGKLGTVPLAAGAFANSVFVVPMVFGMGVTFGLTPLVANADGQNKPALTHSYFWHGLLLNFVMALGLVGLLTAFIPFTERLDQEAAVLVLADPYLFILALSLLPLMLFFTFKQYAEGLSLTRFAMGVSIGVNFFNVFLNWLLIYGNAGFPALGLNGAGYATLISRVIMAIIMGLYIYRKVSIKPVYPARWLGSRLRDLWKLGAPTGLQYIFEVSTFAIAAVMMGWLSAEALAAHQIAISLASVSYMAASGIGAAATVRVGNQLGARQYFSMRRAAHTCFVLTLGLMTLAGIVFWLGRHGLPAFYTSDETVLALAAQLLIVAVFFQLFDGMQATALGALRGMAETRIPTFITFFSYWVVGLSVAYGLGIGLQWGALGIWFGLAIGLVVASILLFWRFERQSRKLIHANQQ